MTETRHLYVHVPFCSRRCSYCDFSIAVRSQVPVAEYVSAISAELEARLKSTPIGPLSTLYLGGGTPTKLGAAGIAQLFSSLSSQSFDISPDTEITVEANPEELHDDALIAALRDAGVNRVSLGVQSFDQSVLTWMHRGHTSEMVRQAFNKLRDAGINDISLDLIFSLPGELQRDWTSDLEQALALNPTHISLYGLTVEPHTPLGRWQARGEVTLAPDERYAEEFLEASRTLQSAGFDHYEVSNFGLPGHESRHNSAYWRRVPYLGIGPSAHSFDGALRRWNDRAYSHWLQHANAGSDPLEGVETLAADQIVAEEVYLGLRTSRGLREHPDDAAVLAVWERAGWASRRDGHIYMSTEGWLRLDSLAADLTAARSR